MMAEALVLHADKLVLKVFHPHHAGRAEVAQLDGIVGDLRALHKAVHLSPGARAPNTPRRM